ESTFSLGGTADLTTSLNFENSDNVTHLLVRGFAGASGDDLDTNDDGTLDNTPWSSVEDCVALLETVGSGDLTYCATTVGPDGSFVPGHAYRCSPGWFIGQFDPAGGADTPGQASTCVADVSIAKTGPALALPDSALTYKLTCANVGTDHASGVVVSDTLPAGVSYLSDDSGLPCPACTVGATGTLTWQVGTISATETLSFSVNGWLTGSVSAGTILTNTASITATGGDSTTSNNGSTWATNVSNLDLLVQKEGPTYAAAGESLAYTVTVQNAGITSALNVVLTDTLPLSTTYVSDDSGWTCAACTPGASGVLTWTAAEVLSQTTHTFRLTVMVDAGVPSATVLENKVQVHTETAGDVPTNNADQWTTAVYPMVTIQDIQEVSDPATDDASPLLGQTVWVTGTVTAEPNDIASNIFVIEDPAGGPWSGLPVYRWSGFSGVSLPRGTQVRLLGKVTEYYGLTEFDIGGTVAVLEILSTGNPVPGPDAISTASFGSSSPATAEQWESVLVEFQDATVTNDNLGYGEWAYDDGSGPAHADDGGMTDGDMTYEPSNGDFYLYMRGIAYYTFSEYKLEPRDDADIRLKATSPALGKSAPSLVAPGELFTYTLTINNDLGFTLNGLVITDVVPADVTFAYALDGGVEDGGVVSWTVASLANLSSVSVRFVVTATTSPAVILNDDYAVVASNFVTPTAGASVGTVVSSEPLRIRDIQGAGHLSPLNGQLVQDVRGVVTLIVGNGFYIQDPDADGDLATSEGILVFGSSAGVSVGDDVLVDGRVAEFYNAGSAGLSTTRIELQGSPTISSSGNTLPNPVIIGVGGRMPPTEIIDDDAGGGSVETAGTFDPQTDGIDFYESLEGMLVQVNDPIAVGPTENDAIPVVGDGGAYATFMAGRNGVMAGVVIREGDFNPERLIVANPNVSGPPDVNVGDHLTGPITGTIDYDDVQTYGNFYLVNANPLSATPGVLSPETTTLTATDGYLTVASFNVYNLDPGDTQYKFDGLADQIVNNLGAPDIVGLQEIQDNNGEVDDGTVDASLTYSTLITAILNAGGPTYAYADIAPENNQDGGAPGGNIRVGFLYRPDRVTLVQRGVATATTATTPVIGATGVELTYSPGRIDPTNPAVVESRKSLAAEFIFNGHKVFVIVNHFNSKSGDAPLFGNVQPPVFASEAERIGIAQMTNTFVDNILTLDPNANVIVLGDLNDFHFSEAVSDVLAADALTNLMYSAPITDRYTYVFEGNSQVLDQILVSDGLVNSAQPEFDVVHVNAEFVADITSSSRRASDHDPVVARFWLPHRYYMPMIMHSSDSGGDASLFGTVQPPVFASEAEHIGIAQMPHDFHLSKAVSNVPAADALTNVIYAISIAGAIRVCLRATRRSRNTMPLIARSG
ncbi:MAG: DUF11 domain-containing protein, partial [Anaerolineae bacterium]|nr:DUF11 domain-containing protein [Anaerolineae bacterium]